ncbi:hypothetical protein [Gordonia sp. KTR9]|uniref:hypothetical protein n=1 Tax=Gordonia sp. KTR9 TaxID=337191 RepID=UPI0011D1FCE8|nr:hypothetical protein [Gordonia sp. KTR9]
MSTPFGDDSLLPSPAPYMPTSPHGPGTVLRSDRAAWERRETAANEAARDLAGAFNSLKEIDSYNYFGDCVEGDMFFEALSGALARLSEQIDHNLATVRSLAIQCKDASWRISSTDTESATNIET